LKVYTEGFSGDLDSVIVLLIFVLGELVIEGSHRDPIKGYKGRPSGVRGRTASKPLGLALFNKARKRIGFVLIDYDLKNV
jgi:hypothetical protein